MIRTDPFTGTVVVNLGGETSRRWHEIGVALLVNGAPVETPTQGTVTARAKVVGTVDWVDFTQPVTLGTTSSWEPFLSGIYEFEFTASNLPANGEIVVTVNNWGAS